MGGPLYGAARDSAVRRVESMLSPVQCTRCHAIYDLCGVSKVFARYLDCTVYESPCCKRRVDDRGEFWTGSPDIRKLTREEALALATRDMDMFDTYRQTRVVGGEEFFV